MVKLKLKKPKLNYRKCKKCEVFRALSFKEKESNQEKYLSHFTSRENIIQEMNRLHNTFISVIKDQKRLIFWVEATKKYSQLLNKYHMELSSATPRNFSFEPSLIAEACNDLEELGLLERKTKNQENH